MKRMNERESPRIFHQLRFGTRSPKLTKRRNPMSHTFHRLCVSTSRDPPIRRTRISSRKIKGLTQRPRSAHHQHGPSARLGTSRSHCQPALGHRHILTLGHVFPARETHLKDADRGDKHPLAEHNKKKTKGVKGSSPNVCKTCRASLYGDKNKRVVEQRPPNGLMLCPVAVIRL